MASSVTLQGIRYRRGLSVVVLVLAVFAAAAAVLVPAYTRAAQESVLRDGLSDSAPWQTELWFDAASQEGNDPRTLHAAADKVLAERPAVGRYFGPGVDGAAERIVIGPQRALALHVYRQDICDHVTITAGRCTDPARPGEILLGVKAAELIGAQVGQPLAYQVMVNGTATPRTGTVAGLYTPKDTLDGYWGRNNYFGGAGSPVADQLDAPVLTGNPTEVTAADRRVTVEYPLKVGSVGLADAARLASDIKDLARQSGAETGSLLPGMLSDIRAEQDALTGSIPLVALPLLLLCLFVLYLAVASVTEERGPEIALAKLRGFGTGRTVRFGLGEALVLVALATPLGLLLGLGFTWLAAGAILADGVEVELRWELLAASLVAVAAGMGTVWLASRRTLNTPALALLRRVPPRARFKAAVGEGIVVALTAVALYQVLAAGDKTSSLALLAAPLLALLAGLGVARGLAMWSRRRVGRALRAGRVPAMLASAQLGRRQSTVRLSMVLTVALSLLGFSTAIWGVADYNRIRTADGYAGASTVYRVLATDPQALLDGVTRADPTGKHAMAAVRISQFYDGDNLTIVGIDPTRFANVAVWPQGEPGTAQDVADKVAVDQSRAVTVKGPEFAAEVTVAKLDSAGPLQLAAWVTTPGRGPREVPLGELKVGTATYKAAVPDCGTGCRLVGLVIQRFPGRSTPYAVDLTVTRLLDGGHALDTRLDLADAWREVKPADATTGSVTPGLKVSVRGTGSEDYRIRYADMPDRLPTVLAGDTPDADRKADAFSILALGANPQQFDVVQRAGLAPRVGEHGILLDVRAEVWSAAVDANLSASNSVSYEVWVAPDAPATLRAALGAAGVQVVEVQSRATRLERLGRAAPALALWLYLAAGVLAVLLAVGAVLLNAYIGVRARQYELAALRIAGLPAKTLRAGVRREYATLLGVPFVVGGTVGLLSAGLMVSAIPLVSAAKDALTPVYKLGPYELGTAGTLTLLGFAGVVWLVLGLVRRADPRLLRSGGQ
ncbi:FtsX-like permease family protein [Longispora sp. NPDC051575]|uniref:FtsX-like permease family protein n=1 Tax=Longispora sp. NPDC051575 TaxID=3154943 RepID=UPI003436189A